MKRLTYRPTPDTAAMLLALQRKKKISMNALIEELVQQGMKAFAREKPKKFVVKPLFFKV